MTRTRQKAKSTVTVDMVANPNYQRQIDAGESAPVLIPANGRKLTPLQQAYERCKLAREELRMVAGCMEVLEDKCGILVERWTTTRGISLVLYSTPHWWNVFEPMPGVEVAATLERIREYADKVQEK